MNVPRFSLSLYGYVCVCIWELAELTGMEGEWGEWEHIPSPLLSPHPTPVPPDFSRKSVFNFFPFGDDGIWGERERKEGKEGKGIASPHPQLVSRHSPTN